MKSRYLISVLLSLILFLGLVNADLGPKPHLTLIITDETGKQISGYVMICTDSFNPGFIDINSIPEMLQYQYHIPSNENTFNNIKNQLNSIGTNMCIIVKDGEESFWFYGLPSKISIVYPIDNGIDENTKVYTTTVKYLPNVMDQIVRIQIGNEVKSKNITPAAIILFTPEFVISFVLTILIEVSLSDMTFKKFGVRKSMKYYVFLANIITVPILWIGIQHLITYTSNYILSFLVMETIAVLIEAIIYWKVLKNVDIVTTLKTSLILNITSAVLGIPVVIFLEMLGFI